MADHVAGLMILVHNHPEGDPTPSTIEVTRVIVCLAGRSENTNIRANSRFIWGILV
jgi:DNA repair protein RadC